MCGNSGAGETPRGDLQVGRHKRDVSSSSVVVFFHGVEIRGEIRPVFHSAIPFRWESIKICRKPPKPELIVDFR